MNAIAIPATIVAVPILVVIAAILVVAIMYLVIPTTVVTRLVTPSVRRPLVEVHAEKIVSTASENEQEEM
jgi:hypothetical protein